MFFKIWEDSDHELAGLEADWNLTKPTLDEQEPETILSIAKLLGYDK